MWKDELRQLARLSGPMAIVQVGYQLTGFVDTLFAAQLGQQALGAVGLGSALFFGVTVLGIGVALGLDPLTSQAFGASDPRRARTLLWQGIYTALLLALPLSLLVWVASYHLAALGVVDELAIATGAYMRARIASLPLVMLSVTLRSYLQSAHATRPVVVAAVLTNVINVLANALLMSGDAALIDVGLPAIGLPALGVVGLGYATALATVAQVLPLALAVRGIAPGEGMGSVRQVRWGDIALQLRVGLPIGLHLITEVGVFSAVQVLMANLGVPAVAAHQGAINLASLSFSVCLGVGAATSVQVGRAIGRGDAAAPRRIGVLGLGLGVGFMGFAAMGMWIFAHALAVAIVRDPEVVPVAATLIRVAGAFQIVDGAQAVAGGALRGAGHTRFIFVAHLLAHWVIGLPLGVLLTFVLGAGPGGLWWGLTAGLAVVAVALVLRFLALTRGALTPLAASADEAPAARN